MYLLDTDILSQTRRPERNPATVDWLRTIEAKKVHLSVITFAEIQHGIGKVRRQDPRFADDLEAWQTHIRHGFNGRILPVTLEIADTYGHLMARIGHDNLDLLIAATALVHGLTVVTANVRHFKPTGVPILDLTNG